MVGGGGREHALVWHLARSGHDVRCAPGNAGISRQARCLPIEATAVDTLAEYARRERIELTITGPEAPLVAGIADRFAALGLPLFGPRAVGARIEGDKVFAKELMTECGIPTAPYAVFNRVDAAVEYLRRQRYPLVVKAAGLAAGKGVVIARTAAEAEESVSAMVSGERFGPAGMTVVIEECLVGEEASVIGLCDGRDFRLLPSSQDHKRLLDDDQGPNTGGMGAYAPAPVVTADVESLVAARVFEPLLAGFRRRGIDYRGVIYAGMMLTAQGPQVLEFNCRFGDPETQAVVPLLDCDLAELALACIEGKLGEFHLLRAKRSALCVVAAAPGYPESYPKGMPVAGVVAGDDVVVFHAGTKFDGDRVVTSGGRVLGVTGLGDTLAQAHDRAYAALGRIGFEGMHFRRDIGARGIAALGG